MDQQISFSAIRSSAGFTMVEVLFTLALASTVASLAIPSGRDAVDELRTAAAARYLAARLAEARMNAVMRATCVGLRFEADGSDYRFTPYADGNNNGIRSLDIGLGIDAPLGAAEKLGDSFPGVSIGLLPGLPDADGDGAMDEDGLRIGPSLIESMSANGTATAGTIYLHGRRSQFAVRVLGTTGRVRVLHYRAAGGGWIAR